MADAVSQVSAPAKGQARDAVPLEHLLGPAAAVKTVSNMPVAASKTGKAGGFPGFAPMVPRAGAAEGRQLKVAKSGAKQSTDVPTTKLRPPVPSSEPQLGGRAAYPGIWNAVNHTGWASLCFHIGHECVMW